MQNSPEHSGTTPKEVLKKYWGFDSFRPLQEDIVKSVLKGKDTVVLLPTGGGKSLCFQVPALCTPGVCLVISPLIALMNDQVANLRRRGINAQAINSSMSAGEIDYALDNAVYGNVKFLYVAPERLQTELFQQRLQKMKISLVAVDEAHCISEWGYDFRPAYLQIATLRQWLSKVPFVALTATATPEVVADIAEKLELSAPKIFQSSFTRSNLAYMVLAEENKYGKLAEALSKTKGSAIVYSTTRRETRQIADFLLSKKITAAAYHAGMDTSSRARAQEDWMQGKIRVMVATNAFGMGIDKPDVRFVIHMGIPAHPEAYFQEAGRAGRDGKKAFALLLHNSADLPALQERIEKQFPDIREIRQVYQALANYYQLAVGSGMEEIYIFNLSQLCSTYKLNPVTTLHALKFLEQSEYISVSDAVHTPSKVQVRMQADHLYTFSVNHPKLHDLIQVLLRSYTGLFDHPQRINEYDLASRLQTDVGHVKKLLNRLVQLDVISYQPANDKPYLTFTRPRCDASQLQIDLSFFRQRKKLAFAKYAAMEAYITNDLICRSRMLVYYFGEKSAPPCGICDVCLAGKNSSRNSSEIYNRITPVIAKTLCEEPLELQSLLSSLKEKKEQVLDTLRFLIDSGDLEYNPSDQKLRLSKKSKLKTINSPQ